MKAWDMEDEMALELASDGNDDGQHGWEEGEEDGSGGSGGQMGSLDQGGAVVSNISG